MYTNRASNSFQIVNPKFTDRAYNSTMTRNKRRNWADIARSRMNDLGIKQNDLLDVLEVDTRGAVSHYFSGRRQLSLPQAEALAHKLGLSMDALFASSTPDSTADLLAALSPQQQIEARKYLEFLIHSTSNAESD